MLRIRRIVPVIIGILIITSAVHADMISTPQFVPAQPQAGDISEQPIQQPGFSKPSYTSDINSADFLAFKFTPAASTDVTQGSEARPQLVLKNEQDSLRFCLSALISMCLYGAVHYVRKIHLGFIPDWYHDGGPFQIGHSHAVTPHSLCPELACCFIQPVWMTESLIPRYHQKVLVSLWRQSQYTPEKIASRGPPLS